MAARRQTKFVISPFRHSVRTDPEYAQRTWATLQQAITKINERKTSELSFEELYRFSYNMVLHKYGDILYDGLTGVLSEHLAAMAEKVAAADPATFLSQLQMQWAWFKISLNHVRDILMYMDRTYVPTKKKKTVHDLGVALFRDHVIRNEAINTRLVETVLSKIECERSGEAIDTHLIRSVTRMLAELGEDLDGVTPVYVNVFENPFLEETRQFYAREAKLYLAETTCSDYLRKASQRIQEERLRVELYLDPQTGNKVRRVAEHELISNYMKVLVEMENSGLIWMLRNDKCYDLQLMCSLFRHVPGGEMELRSNLKNEVLERGLAIINDSEMSNDPVALVTAVIALKEKYDRILKIAFFTPQFSDGSLPLAPEEYLGGTPGGTERAAAPPIDSRAGASSGDSSSAAVTVAAAAASAAAAAAVLASNAAAAAAAAAADVGSSSAAGGTSAIASGTGTPGSTLSSAPASVHVAPRGAAERVPDRKFVTGVNEAFERFVNTFPRAPEYISLFVDRLLRQDLKASTDDEIEAKLDMVMTLFRFLHEKDVFERYYKQHLCKRLLHNRTTSHDAERSFMTKLKTECGYLYTSKMETMFLDMRTSAETTEQFRGEVADAPAELADIDVNVAVLTTISWPITNMPPCVLPSGIARCYSRYETFYYGKHEGRRLTWQTQMANGELRAYFGNGTRQIDLAVSGYGLCILMHFNDMDRLTFDEIAARTGIPLPELTRNLQSLAMGKHRVINKEPRGRDIKGSDAFVFNDGFSCRNRRIKIQMVSAQRESEEERNETRTRVDEDRNPLIDSAIVRIMKDRKILEHQQLIAEVTAQVASRFAPNPQDIKKRIESLVDREFLERSADRRSTYTYLA
jgi:Cullin family/Cullin protein neddylation domain